MPLGDHNIDTDERREDTGGAAAASGSVGVPHSTDQTEASTSDRHLLRRVLEETKAASRAEDQRIADSLLATEVSSEEERITREHRETRSIEEASEAPAVAILPLDQLRGLPEGKGPEEGKVSIHVDVGTGNTGSLSLGQPEAEGVGSRATAVGEVQRGAEAPADQWSCPLKQVQLSSQSAFLNILPR